LRTLDLPVAVDAPLVEIIPARRWVNFILRIVRAVNVDDLAGLNLGAALVGKDFRFALMHDQQGLTGGIHLNAVNPRRQRMYAHVRGVNLHVRLGAIKNREIHQARGQLDLHLVLLEVRHLGFRALVEPHHVGRVELDFRPRLIRRRHFVTRHHGSVHRARHPIARITVHG
jgi:hypothetical protein